MRRIFGRVFGVRVWLRWDSRRQRVVVDPDDDDLESAPADVLVAFWAAWGTWADDFTWRYPDWTVNGVSRGAELADITAEIGDDLCKLAELSG